jgi:hypothetical protein
MLRKIRRLNKGGNTMIDYLSNVKTNNVIPSYASVNEGYLYVIEASEKDFYSMMKTIGLDELGILEATGKPAIYEAGKISAVIDNAIGFLKKLWANLKGMFTKVLSTLKTSCIKFKKWWDHDGDVIHLFINTIAKSKSKKLIDGSFGMLYSYENMDEIIHGKGVLWKAVNSYDDTLFNHSLVNLDVKAYTPNRDANNAKQAMEKAKVQLIKAMALGSDANDTSIKERVKTYIRGSKEPNVEVNKAFIQKNFDEMVRTCAEYRYVAEKVTALFNVAKKDINDEIKKLNSLKSKIDMDIYQQYMESIKFGKQTVVTICNAATDCLFEQQREYRKILFKLATASKANAKNKYDSKMHTEAAADDNAGADTDDTSDDDSQPQEEGQQSPDVAKKAAQESENEAAKIALESVSYQAELASLFNF